MRRTIKELQEFLGVTADGLWGAQSQKALESMFHTEIVPVDVPTSGASLHWPKEADAALFYGHSDGSSRWEEQNLVVFDAPYELFMDGEPVHRIRCHKLVKDSLLRILSKVKELYPTPEARARAGVDQYDGCYNFRAVRGASHLSMHAYGAAIDMDAAHNPLGATHGRMPMEVVKLFKDEGWRWGGDYQNRKDWMHFEACS